MRLLGYNSPRDADVYSSIHFYFFTRNYPILCLGIKLIPQLSLSEEMPFTKVCVTAPYERFIVYIYHFAIQTNMYV